MRPEWVAEVEELLSRPLSSDELEMGARMDVYGQSPAGIAVVLESDTPVPPAEQTYRFESVGHDARPIP